MGCSGGHHLLSSVPSQSWPGVCWIQPPPLPLLGFCLFSPLVAQEGLRSRFPPSHKPWGCRARAVHRAPGPQVPPALPFPRVPPVPISVSPPSPARVPVSPWSAGPSPHPSLSPTSPVPRVGMGTGLSGAGGKQGGKTQPPRGCGDTKGADTGGDSAQPGRGPPGPAAPGAGPGLRAELPAVPHSGEAASAGGRCQQALAGSELRSDSRHRCPCFNSSAMEPGRPGGGGGGSAAPGAAGSGASPARPGRGSGDHRDPPIPLGAAVLSSPRHKTGDIPPILPPTSLPVPHIPPDPRAAPGPRSGAASAARRAPGAGSLRFFMVSAILAEICL